MFSRDKIYGHQSHLQKRRVRQQLFCFSCEGMLIKPDKSFRSEIMNIVAQQKDKY